jgi:hypothetical protein
MEKMYFKTCILSKFKFLIYSILITFCFISSSLIYAQFSKAERDRIYKYTSIDFQDMKTQLGIKMENRPGPSGDPSSPNAANSDESKVRSYKLLGKNGARNEQISIPGTSFDQWRGCFSSACRRTQYWS